MADYSFVTHRGTLVTPNWKIWDDAYGLHAIKTMELVQNSLGSTLGPSAGIPFILITAQHSKAKKKRKKKTNQIILKWAYKFFTEVHL